MKGSTKAIVSAILVLVIAVPTTAMYFNGGFFNLSGGTFGINPNPLAPGPSNTAGNPNCATGTQWNGNQCVAATGPASCGSGTYWNGQQCVLSTGGSSCNAQAVVSGAQAKVGAADGMTNTALTSTTNFYIFAADHTQLIDTIAVSASVSTGTALLSPGTPYAFELESTAGNGYYPGWFTVHQGWTNCSPVYYVEAGMGSNIYGTPYGPSNTNGVPYESVVEVAVGTMNWVAGTTNYWQITGPNTGPLKIFQRESSANLKFGVDVVGGTRGVRTATGTTVSTGNVFSHASDYTAASQTWAVNLNIQTSDLSEVWGYPFIHYGQLPGGGASPQMYIGYGAVWIAFNNTNIVPTALTGASPAWNQLPNGITPGYQDFVQLIAPVESTPSTYGVTNVNIPINTGSINGLNTGVGLAIWAADMQSTAVYTSTAADPAPSGGTIYAPVAAYGLTATIHSSGFSVNSSNAPQTALTYVVFLS